MKETIASQDHFPLADAIKQSKYLPSNVSALEVFNVFKFVFGYAPERNHDGRCVYSFEQLKVLALTSCMDNSGLLELEEWRKLLPLAGCKTRMAAMEKLSRLGIDGWLKRCSYRRGQLLLCKEDAEQLCYVKGSGYRSRPARWSVPVAFQGRRVVDQPT